MKAYAAHMPMRKRLVDPQFGGDRRELGKHTTPQAVRLYP